MLASRFVRLAVIAALPLTAACIGEPFGYASDRCAGSHNMCQTECASIDNGPARSACMQRCYDRETQCYATGHDGSSIAVDRAVGEARTEAEKEADFQRWKARRAKESAEKEAQEEAGSPDETQTEETD